MLCQIEWRWRKKLHTRRISDDDCDCGLQIFFFLQHNTCLQAKLTEERRAKKEQAKKKKQFNLLKTHTRGDANTWIREREPDTHKKNNNDGFRENMSINDCDVDGKIVFFSEMYKIITTHTWLIIFLKNEHSFYGFINCDGKEFGFNGTSNCSAERLWNFHSGRNKNQLSQGFDYDALSRKN